MWFTLSKILMLLMLPPACLIVLLLAGLFLTRKHPACGKLLIIISTIFLYLLSLPLTADLLIKPLESAAPPFNGNAGSAAAVVVLGGGVLDLSWVPAQPAPSEASLARTVFGIELARIFRLPLVIAGGSGAIDGSDLREAEAMTSLAVRMGLPAKQVLTESRSRNTRENARAVRELLDRSEIILVTSAFHMKRAAALFTKQGFSVRPAPTDYRSQTRTSSWTNLIPGSGHLETSSRAIAEYLSTAWYRLAGAL